MPLATLPPQFEEIIDDKKVVTLPWQIFFEALSTGDAGVSWSPTFVGLTSVGTPTITGKYYKLSANIVYFSIKITPATNTSAVNGTTYCDNFPLAIFQSGTANSTIQASAAPAGVDSATNRIYTATWTNQTVPVTITGTIEAR